MVRELRVVGLEPDGTHVVLADPENGDRFRIPIDDTLRAASRGDLARLGQIQIETTSQLRPREIQARIRSGASVEQVAEEAGIPLAKVERFAYPVLLERSRAAEMAQQGHPVRPDGPAVHTLAEIVAQAFRARGHSIDAATWDAWRDDEGHWVAQLQWAAGRSINTGHWRYQPDAHGGTILPLDDTATELIDPDCGRPLRCLTPVYTARDVDDSGDNDGPDREDVVAEAITLDPPPAVIDAEVEEVRPMAASLPEPDAEEDRPKLAPQQSPGKDKRGKPALPSWDDVLLGVRSNGRV
nr:septation protein SepH [Rhodococcus sp. 14C212]